MDSVGPTLRHARLEQGLDLDTVAARTRINVRYLIAIEADDRKALPSGFFYKSFVDQYAKLLSLDTVEIHAEVDRLLSEDAPLPLPGYSAVVSKRVPPMKSSSRFGWGRVAGSFALFAAVVLGCSGVYVWWNRERLNSVTAKEHARSAPNPPASPVQRTSPPSSSNGSGTNVPVALAARQNPVDAPAVSESAAPVAPSEAAQAAIDPSYKVLLDLVAREETWLSVTSEGKKLFSGVLAPNQSKTLAGKDRATMKIGNAAGVEVHLNGKLLAPLGARGQVLVVVFTPDAYQIVPPAPREGD